MGTTGTGNTKPLVCSLLFMNEQREGEEGAISSGAWECAGAGARLLRRTGVTSSGAAPRRDRQALPGFLSPALPPSVATWSLPAPGWVGHRALGVPSEVLSGCWAPLRLPTVLPAQPPLAPRALQEGVICT